MYNPKYIALRKPLQKPLQQGFSLVELMVGIAIGLLVVVAAMGSLVYTQISATVVGDSTRLQQKADNAFRLMGYQVQQAGAINLQATLGDPSVVTFNTAFTGYNPSTTGATVPSQIFAVHGAEGASNAPDTLRVSYQDDNSGLSGTVRDCLGNIPDAAQVNIRVDNQFSVVSGELVCTGAQPTTLGTANTQALVDGVEDFQVSYGVETGAYGARRFQFFRADQVTDWTQIQAIRVCLQLVGDIKGNPQTGLVVTGCRAQTVANNGLLRRVFWRNYSLRNALKEGNS